MTLRVLIVDDEPPARRLLTRLLGELADVEVVGQCADGEQARAAIAAKAPDLVLLDIQMPGESGLDVVRAVGPEHMPPVVFVTAHDEHALQAFELCAVDYLLKPVDPERLARAVERVRERDDERALAERLGGLLARLDAQPEHLTLRSGGRVLLVRPERVTHAEAAGNYVRLQGADGEQLVRATVKELLGKLQPWGFLQIHRSILVNPRAVRELHAPHGNEPAVLLRDGTRLPVGSRHRAALDALLG